MKSLAALKRIVCSLSILAAGFVAGTVQAGLPNPGMNVEPGKTALVLTDPQNDLLSPNGVTWGVVGKSVEANKTVEHIEILLKFLV